MGPWWTVRELNPVALLAKESSAPGASQPRNVCGGGSAARSLDLSAYGITIYTCPPNPNVPRETRIVKNVSKVCSYH